MQFQLNFKSGKPVYLQLVDQVKAAAASGAKKQAKKKAKDPGREDTGGSVFVERRYLGAGDMAAPLLNILN